MKNLHANKSYGLTKAQKRVWFNLKLSEKPMPNIAMVFELKGGIDIWGLRKALENIVEENPVLKSTIYSSAEQLERIVNDNIRGHLEFVDLTIEEKPADIYWLLQSIMDVNFNLATGPLFQFNLIKQNEYHHYFTILVHPIIIDRYSVKYLVAEISRHYNAIATNQHKEYLIELFDFNQIVELEKQFYSSSKYRHGLTHWTNTLKTNQFYIDLPKQGFFTKEHKDSPFFEIFLPQELSEQIKIFAKQHQVDVYVVLLSAYQVLLQRYTGNHDIIINYSNAVSYTSKKVFGCLENRLPLRVILTDNITFTDLVTLTNKQLTHDRYYQDVQINDIVKSVRDKFDRHFTGIFSNTSFDINYLPYEELKLGKITSKLIPKYMKKFVTENLAIYCCDTGKTFSIIADFDEHIDNSAIKNMLRHYENLLINCITKPEKSIFKQSILSIEEYKQIVIEWNQARISNSPELAHQLFEKQVIRTPHKTAIVYENEQLTYQELNQKTNQLADLLIKQLALYPENQEKMIGICLGRSLEMIISMLAIMKAGAAYVPLDPQNPRERLSYILDNTQMKIIITTQLLQEKLNFLNENNRHVICLDQKQDELTLRSKENPNVQISSTALVYVIYTSGSTGLPKGVMIEHRNLRGFIASYNQYFEILPESRVLQFSSMNFDAAIPEIFNSLAYGASIFVASEQLKQSPEKLIEFLDIQKISHAIFPPAFLKILPKKELPYLQTLLFGGDICDQETMDYWAKGRRFINGYGPTEITVNATCSILNSGDLVNRIGRPLANFKAYILDQNLQPVPIGIIGELYIGGIGVGRGYVNRPDITAERFIKNPFVNDSNQTMYKTGDLVRWLPDGQIEYIGRCDFEVKIRGFRIHLGDIEHVLESFPGVKQATTKLWQKSGVDKVIAAYYLLKEGYVIDNLELKNHLQKNLPDYMLPSYLLEVDEMPISVSGKINKELLPDPFPQGGTAVQVECKEEQALKDIWIELFKIPANAITPYSDFFDLGGHSLLATQLVSRIKSKLKIEITVKQIFQNSQLKQLAKLLRESTECQFKNFELYKAPLQDLYPLSYSHKRLWYFYKTMPQSAAYNILLAVRFKDVVDVNCLQQALENLCNEHEIFNTVFIEKNGEIYQKIVDKIKWNFPICYCESEQKVNEQINMERRRLFKLDTFPLFTCNLLHTNKAEVILVLNIHHIIFDGWSLEVLMRDLGAHYSALIAGNFLETKKPQYTGKDFAFSQILWNEQGQFNQQMAYWQRKLSMPLPILDLPIDYKRPKELSFDGDIVKISLVESMVKDLKKIALNNKVSLFSLLLSIYYVLLYRLTGQRDIIVASPTANRNREELENLIGLFANVATYRAQINNPMTFDQLLMQVNNDVILAQENQDLPFDLIVNKSLIERDPSRNPIFQTMFVLQNGFNLSGSWEKCEINYIIDEIHTNTSKFDLVLILNDNSSEENISGYFEFNSTLFSKKTIERFTQYFLNILRSIAENPQRNIENIPVLSTEESKTLIHDWNQTHKEYQKEPIHTLFERQVEKYPDHIAVVYQNEKINYRELNCRANRLAHFIIKQMRVTSPIQLSGSKFIGLCLPRGIDMIVAILAVLKSGSAYIPLDPNYPQDRLNYILDDTQAKIILTKKELLERHTFLKNKNFVSLCIDEEKSSILQESVDNLNQDVKINDIAYVIYTSGSTGLPKGVMIEHRGVPNLAETYQQIFAIDANSRVLQYASINFDAAVPEIFTPLLCGACVYIIPDELRYSSQNLVQYMDINAINMAVIPPALLKILPKNHLPALRALAFAGDSCDQSTIDFWAKDRIFINAYGPTEATVCATFSVLKSGDPANRIGKPLPNYKTYVLDDNLNPVPIGVRGELYIGGIGLARGYLNRPDLTVERFIVNPFSDNPQDYIYKTGDRVRRLQDSNLEYLGRSDYQVQIRGFRVELGEIETVLGFYPAVREVVVSVRENQDLKFLIAYYTTHNDIVLDSNELKRFIQSKLPDYMIPTAFIKISEIPLSPSGKVDKKLLPMVDDVLLNSPDKYVAPRNEIENCLVNIWSNLFGHKKIGVHDSFFNFGGNSLLTIKMLSKVNELFGSDITLGKFFQHPTIEGLADLLAGREMQRDIVAMAIADSQYSFENYLKKFSEKFSIKNVLLTGANGFLGSYLLKSLLEHTECTIYCLIRGDDIFAKMQKSLDKYHLSYLLNNARVHLLNGDLAQSKLGMSAETWRFCAEEIDIIYHNGAWVNHIYDYELLKATNVNSTIELLNLCFEGKEKYFNYISTLSAATQFDEKGTVLETGPGDVPPQGPGYLLSKWVSEKIIMRAIEKGVKAFIYRPGNITGDSFTGMTQFENNHALLLLKSCIQLGVAPAWQAQFEMTPVNILSDAIVKLSLQSHNSKHVFHLANPNGLNWENYFNLIGKLGYKMNIIPSHIWRDDYIKHIDDNNALFPLKELYLQSTEADDQKIYFESEDTQQILKKLGVEYLTQYETQMKIYLDYLGRENFLPLT